MRLLRIYFVKGEEDPDISRKTFRLTFNRNAKGLKHCACFCWQDYPKCFIKSNNNKIVKIYKVIKAPTIIVTKQDSFLKTLRILIHEFGHYIVWLLFYWKKPMRLEKKIELKGRPKIFGFFTDLYDRIDRWITSTDNIYV